MRISNLVLQPRGCGDWGCGILFRILEWHSIHISGWLAAAQITLRQPKLYAGHRES